MRDGGKGTPQQQGLAQHARCKLLITTMPQHDSPLILKQKPKLLPWIPSPSAETNKGTNKTVTDNKTKMRSETNNSSREKKTKMSVDKWSHIYWMFVTF